MADPVPDAVSKVEDRVEALLLAAEGLAGWTVKVHDRDDVALEDSELNAIVIRTIGPEYDPSFEYGAQILNALVLDIEAKVVEPGTNRQRRAREGLVQAHAALTADHTFDGMLQDITEVDSATETSESRDSSGVSLQFRLLYFTARDDLNTIIGHGGETF